VAKFLLDAGLSPLRLHIQIEPEKNDGREDRQSSDQDQRESSKFLHAENVTQGKFEEKMKAEPV